MPDDETRTLELLADSTAGLPRETLAGLFDDIRSHINRFIGSGSSHAPVAVTLWIAHCYVVAAAAIAAYRRIRSAAEESGKWAAAASSGYAGSSSTTPEAMSDPISRKKEGVTVFRRKRKAPSTPFTHAEDCRILRTDPSVEMPWNYDGGGLWKAECVCTTEYFREPITDDRVRLDPYDPATARHLGQCEYASETDPAIIKVLLKVTDKGDYDWVECGSCDAGWQVAHYAESVG